MRALSSFDYATIRVVPRVEREEFVNAGVVLYSAERAFLGARVHLDAARMVVLSPDVDLTVVQHHLDAFPKICRGDEDAGPIARLTASQRFHWLVAPRSTVIQVSPVHSGLCESPEHSLEELFRQLVLL